VIDRLLGLGPRDELSGTASPESWLVDWVSDGGPTAAGERISERTALACAAVKACVLILSETVACLPLPVYERRPNGDKRLATDHPVYALLNREANGECDGYRFRETLQGHLGTFGNGYAEIERAYDRTPVALWQRSPKPSATKPYRGEDGQLWYHLRDDTLEADVRDRDMIHVAGFGFNGLVGYSPIRHLKEPIGNAKAAERYAGELFANDARASGYFTHPGKLSQPAYDRLKENLTGDLHGRRHRKQVLEEGMTYAAESMSPKDVQMIDARRLGAEDIARAYRIPLHLLQLFMQGVSSYASIVELGREFLTYTMLPWFKRWEGELNRKLLLPPYFCEFNQTAFLQADPKARGEFYWRLWQMGAIDANSILRRENMNGIGDEGDVRFVPVNMQPLKHALAGPPKPPSPAPDDPEDDGGEDDEEDDRDGKKGGDGKIAPPSVPSAPSVVPPPPSPADALEAFFRDAQTRMVRREHLAAQRWTREPGRYTTRLDAFLAKHRDVVTEALRPVIDAGYRPLADLPGHEQLGRLVDEHLARSRALLLELAECPAGELADSLATYAERRTRDVQATCDQSA